MSLPFIDDNFDVSSSFAARPSVPILFEQRQNFDWFEPQFHFFWRSSFGFVFDWAWLIDRFELTRLSSIHVRRCLQSKKINKMYYH